MVQKEYIFRFLRDLRANNSKEWMDENRERYHTAKERWIEEVELILKRLQKHDSIFIGVKPKSTLTRINNNRRFQPDKPVYKDFFTATPSGGNGFASVHVSVGPGSSFVGGGAYRPDKEMLDKVRAAFDYNGEAFKEIIDDKQFKKFFGGLNDEMAEKLKTSPQGYSNEHPHVDLLRYKSLVASRDLTEEEVCSDSFVDLVEEAYLTLKPMNAYLNKAIDFEA